jgi:hypothetical protein
MVRQPVLMDGISEHAIQIVDLFITKAFRSRGLIRRLYDEVERQCLLQEVRFALGMPNARAISVNERFLKLRPFLRLPVRIGLAIPKRSAAVIFSAPFDSTKKQDMLRLLAPYRTARTENGIAWQEEALYQRLCSPKHRYGLHATEDLLLISSARTRRHVRYTLLCGFFAHAERELAPACVRNVIRAACRLWNRPLFAYIGFNKSLPGPQGISLPRWLRRSPMLLQLRDFRPENSKPQFHRFQALDFDFD